ncbi:hypothetical protein EON65_38370 [archaeon]|nr:MAG: hypothetical protein EON65_38370 [archaeon]
MDPEWSFFNLEIELLLEGLPNANKCEEYQFHEERGYGVSYFTQVSVLCVCCACDVYVYVYMCKDRVCSLFYICACICPIKQAVITLNMQEESIEMKNNFLAKLSREKRSQDRQRNRHVSKEDQARQLELNRRKEEEEKEMSKKLLAMEKEKREKLKEENKKQRDEETEAKKKEREDKRKLELKEKENMKDRQKKIVAYKREILAEVKKHRALATQAVLEYFDTEESLMDGSAAALSELNDVTSLAHLLPKGTAQEILQAPDLDTFFASLPTLPSLLDTPESRKLNNRADDEDMEEEKGQQDNEVTDSAMVTEEEDKARNGDDLNGAEMWDAIFDITMTVNLLRNTLNIDHSVSPATVLTAVSNKEQSEKVCGILSALQGERVDSLPVDPEAEFDRLTLNMTRPLLPALHSLMDLDQKDIESTGRKDKRLAAVRYPLNSLTFLELLRMNILYYLGSQPLRSEEDIRTKEDIQHMIRGSKAASYRIAKNIVRNIRYKWHVRNVILDDPAHNKCVRRRREIVMKLLRLRGSNIVEDQLRLYADIYRAEVEGWGDSMGVGGCGGVEDKLMVMHEEKLGEAPESLTLHRKHLRPPINVFNTEQELMDGLASVCTDLTYPPVYPRLACVLIKILNTTAAKNLIWEVDQELYTDYYSTILRPIMLTNVASNLVNRAYDEGAPMHTHTNTHTPYNTYVSREFYADVRQVCINVLVYNSELSPICAQAQRLLQVLHRHMVCWVEGVLRGNGDGRGGEEGEVSSPTLTPPPLLQVS